MYNMKLKDYTLSAAREMIQLDQANRIDDYLYNDGGDSRLDFLADPGLIFFLTGEGSVPLDLKLIEVLEDQFSWMKIDLALAYALVVKNDSGDHGPETPEQSDTSDILWSIISDVRRADLSPCFGVATTVQQNQLFKIYQIRRRIRYAFRNLATDWCSQRFLRASLDKISDYLESHMPEFNLLITWRVANAAIIYWLEQLEEKGEVGSDGYLLRLLYSRGVISDPYIPSVYDDDEDGYYD